MEVNKFTGKDYDTVLQEALDTLNLKLEDVVVYKEEKKQGLFKGTMVELTVTPLTDIVEFTKEYLKDVLSSMKLEVTFESKIRENQITVIMHSDDNPILIGHGGKNLSALQTVVRNVVKTKFGVVPYISLDVENYKDRQIMHLERTARRIAKEVAMTKVAVELDNMNAYERLIVHQEAAKNPNVITESVGEEPYRHVVIKPKED